jgi:hypothetical protein
MTSPMRLDERANNEVGVKCIELQTLVISYVCDDDVPTISQLFSVAGVATQTNTHSYSLEIPPYAHLADVMLCARSLHDSAMEHASNP